MKGANRVAAWLSLLAGLCVSGLYTGCREEAVAWNPTVSEWADSLQTVDGIRYFLRTKEDGIIDTFEFADMPHAVREIHLNNCGACHANSWYREDARASLALNTWEDIITFGPLRFYLIAKRGNHPDNPDFVIAPEALEELSRFLGQNTPSGVPPGSMPDLDPPEVRRVAEKYCGSCHGTLGSFLISADLRSVAGWMENRIVALEVLTTNRASESMPPSGSTQASALALHPEDKALLIAWLQGMAP